VFFTLSKEGIMRIYLARPISGCGYDEVVNYYQETVLKLQTWGYEVLFPMCGKEYLRNEVQFKAEGYGQPLSTNRAIVGRDRWMVRQSDIVFANLVGAKTVSIGTVCELAWAFDNKKHVILAMEQGNIHRHAFVLEFADVLFENAKDALAYLKKLAEGSL
jgi:nucleoside 2-deoxyribosyltransferase